MCRPKCLPDKCFLTKRRGAPRTRAFFAENRWRIRCRIDPIKNLLRFIIKWHSLFLFLLGQLCHLLLNDTAYFCSCLDSCVIYYMTQLTLVLVWTAVSFIIKWPSLVLFWFEKLCHLLSNDTAYSCSCLDSCVIYYQMTQLILVVVWKAVSFIIKWHSLFLFLFGQLRQLLSNDTAYSCSCLDSWAFPGMVIANHRFERITRHNLGLASIGNSLETVGSNANNP